MTGLLWKKLAGLSRPVVIAFALAGVFGVIAAVSYTHLTLPTIYSV